MDTAQFPGHLSETKAGTQYEVLARSMALLRLSTPAIKEKQKAGFVAAEVIAEAAMDVPSKPESVSGGNRNEITSTCRPGSTCRF